MYPEELAGLKNKDYLYSGRYPKDTFYEIPDFVNSDFLAGCASSYKPIRPQSTYFPAMSSSSGIDFSYKLGVLREMGNKKYAKREDRKAIRLASVKIVNETGRTLIIGKDIFFYSGTGEAVLLSPEFLHKQLKQGVPIYLLYLLFTPMKVYQYSDYGSTVSSTPVGLALVPGLTIGNMVLAGTANQSFLKEVTQYNMINKSIGPGETVYGIIGIRDIGYSPIIAEVSKS